MATITNRLPAIKIEYTARNARAVKVFAGDEIAKAKHLFAAKLNANKDPKVLAGDAAAITGTPAAAPAVVEENPAEPLTQAVATKSKSHKPTKAIKVEPVAGATRPTVCGMVLAGLSVIDNVTAEMVAAVDTAYGDSNPRESRFALRNAKNAILGWCQQMGIDPSTGKALPKATK